MPCAGSAVWKRSNASRWADGHSERAHAAQQDGELEGGVESQTGNITFCPLLDQSFNVSLVLLYIMFLNVLQVLIASHLPSYELRHNQVESIFLSAIDMYGHQFCPENLKVSLVWRSFIVISNKKKQFINTCFCVLFPGAETHPLWNVHFWCFAQFLLSLQSSRLHGCLGGMLSGLTVKAYYAGFCRFLFRKHASLLQLFMTDQQ